MKVRRTRPETTWNDYKDRILRVLTHIQEHLDEPLELEALAQVACFSSFHFHRVFAAMTGETIADHVRRLRMERAALALRAGAKQVIQLALDAGYEAHEAFTRAFKSAYGVSPVEFRRAVGPITVLAAPSGVHYRPGVPLTTFNTNHITRKIMKVMTKKIKPMRVAYLRHLGPYEKVGQTWMDITARLSEAQQIGRSSVFIGIPYDDPKVTPAAEIRYDACITVDEKYEPKAPVAVQTIAGGDCAIVKNCLLGEIKDAYQHLFGKWLPRSTRELRPAPSFMVMLNAGKGVPPAKQRVDIYVPLQPRRPRQKIEPMSIRVERLQPLRVAYMRYVGPYNKAFEVWKDFTIRLGAGEQLKKDARYIGIPHDDPNTIAEEKLRFDACVTVDDQFVAQKPMAVQTIEGGDYVVAANCPIGGIAKGYQKLFSSWLPKSGRRARKAPSFLMSVNHPKSTPPAFGLTDIYVPLEAEK